MSIDTVSWYEHVLHLRKLKRQRVRRCDWPARLNQPIRASNDARENNVMIHHMSEVAGGLILFLQIPNLKPPVL